jgi:hypothetical protein
MSKIKDYFLDNPTENSSKWGWGENPFEVKRERNHRAFEELGTSIREYKVEDMRINPNPLE